jgi:hypothetical protein
MYPYALVLWCKDDAMCYNEDMNNRLRFNQVEPRKRIVVRLLVKQGKHAVVREYCGIVQPPKPDDAMMLRLKTISGCHRRLLSEPKARELRLPLYMREDGMIHVAGDPTNVYGYALPAVGRFVRYDVPPVATYVDRPRIIGQVAA